MAGPNEMHAGVQSWVHSAAGECVMVAEYDVVGCGSSSLGDAYLTQPAKSPVVL